VPNLFFMCITVIPSLLYYAYLPAIGLSLFFGLFIYLQDKKNSLNRILLSIAFIFAAWVTLAFTSWFPWTHNQYMAIQRFLLLVLILLPLFIYFAYSIVGIKLTRLRHILIWIPIVPILILNFSPYNNLIYTLDSQCFVWEGMLYPYIYALIPFYLVWFLFILVKKYANKNTDQIVKKQISMTLFASAILIIWTGVFNKMDVFFGEDILIVIPFGMVIFIGLLTFAITKYHLMNIKLLAAQALVVSLVAILGSELFFAESTTNKILILITLLISVGLGYMLVRSVRLEHQRREELQIMSDKLAQANDKLVKLDNAKSEFISIASHQLRTPLTSIKGYTSLLLEGSYGKVDSKQEDVLNKIYSSNERLVNLVEDLLNISRIESGRMEFTFDKWKMEDLCKEVVDGLMLKAKGRDLYLDFKLPETPMPLVTIDGAKVREVISNMTDNAIKYTKKGGVKVKLEFLKGSEQRVNCGEGSVRVTVSDTGIGIPLEEMPYLFGKFSRGKDTSRLNTGGTGLGLYVGKRMIEANGGIIWAESEGANLGSRFIIEIPANMDEKEREQRLEKLLKEI
jgi:signal transduction histidine kinase